MEKLSTLQDKELVVLLKDGSRQAFGELYARFKELLMHICKQYLKNEADLEDMVHDIFLQLWEKRHLLNVELSFSGYVQTIAQNYSLKKLRHLDVHSRFARDSLLNGSDSTDETMETVIDNDYTRLLNELVESLPPMQKEVFRLNRIEGLTYQEISDLLQISPVNVRNHASIALKKIKKQLQTHKDIYFQMIIYILMFFT